MTNSRCPNCRMMLLEKCSSCGGPFTHDCKSTFLNTTLFTNLCLKCLKEKGIRTEGIDLTGVCTCGSDIHNPDCHIFDRPTRTEEKVAVVGYVCNHQDGFYHFYSGNYPDGCKKGTGYRLLRADSEAGWLERLANKCAIDPEMDAVVEPLRFHAAALRKLK